MKQIQLIAMDLDGTLFTDDKQISEKNRKAILEAQHNGIRMVICTGRLREDVAYYLKRYKLCMDRICCNGAVVATGDIHTETILETHQFKAEEARDLIALLLQYPLMINAFTNGYTITHASDDAQKYHLVERGIIREKRGITALLEGAERGIYKFYITWDRTCNYGMELLKYTREEVHHAFPGCEISQSDSTTLEIMPNAVNKGNTLLSFAKKIGIDQSGIMAIGDEENDLPMLKMASFSVAMGNAADSVKKLCRFITASNENAGVAEAIYYAMNRENTCMCLKKNVEERL